MTRETTRLRIEALEDRRLLATCHVTRLSDAGAGFGFRGDLRYCINKVNIVPGPDSIDFNVTGTILLTAVLPDLSTELDIVGPGQTALTLERNSGGEYRIFTVGTGAVVRITGLTATDGNASSQGGAIRNQGTLTLTDVNLTRNIAGFPNGPDGYGGGIHNSGTLLIQDSSVSANDVFGDDACGGGGIYNASTGTLTIVNSLIAGNKCKASNAEFTFANGGGIWNAGSTTIQYSTIANNSAETTADVPSASGGGIYTTGPLTITNTTVSGNYLAAYPLGDSDGFTFGSGIYFGSATLTVDNSTIANNHGIWPVGTGAIHISGGSATITHSTIAGNSRGIRIGGQLTLRNSIVAKNGSTPNTVIDLDGALTSSGYNLIGKSAGGSGYVPSDILDVDPLLGPLAGNGGPTLTMALLPGSPAIDSGTNHMAPEWDQRGPGFPRIVNGTIDRGAFEVQSTPAPIAPDYLAVLITAKIDDDD